VSLKDILKSTLKAEQKKVSSQVIDHLALYANGDARSALNSLELILNTENYEDLSFETIKKEVLNQKRDYDKSSNRHYDVISAFIKSVRGSDVDSAILWLAIMLDGGEDPDFIARRLIILASEDIGNADPRGLQMATSCHYAIKTIGMPEARIILAQATTYLASAPKSNSSYLAIDKALDFVRDSPTIEVPTHLQNNHPDKKNYKYPHSYNNHWVKQSYKEEQQKFFETSGIAYERMQKEYLDKIKRDH
jgi:putative ATPase